LGFTGTLRAVYMIRGPRTTFADQRLASTVTFFRITRNIFHFGTCLFKVARNIKTIFRVNSSSRSFDSGKMFEIIIFTRGPRTTYCPQRENGMRNWMKKYFINDENSKDMEGISMVTIPRFIGNSNC